MNFLERSWIFNFFLKSHEAQKTVYTYKANVPGMSRSSNLRLQVAGVFVVPP